MKRGKVKLLACMAGLSIVICACSSDEYLELSDDSYNKVINYAAGMLMKYGVGSQDKLTYLDPTYTPEHLAAEVVSSVGTSEAASSVTTESTDSTSADTATAYESTGAESGDTEAEEAGENAGTGASEGTVSEEETGGTESTDAYETGSTQIHSCQDGELAAETVLVESSFLQSLSDQVQIEYIGYSVRANYPDAQTQGAVSAAIGDKLLVLTFHARNVSDAELLFNTVQSGVKYKLVINSDISGFCLTTMLDNDLSGVYMNIGGGTYAEVVLLMEVPESIAKNVDSLDLVILQKGEQQTIRLE